MNSTFVDVLISLRIVGGVARLEFGKVSEVSNTDGKPQVKVTPTFELLIPAGGLKEAVQSVSKALASDESKATPQPKA